MCGCRDLLTSIGTIQMLQPLYTMNGFNWFDKRGVEGVGFVRVLRTLLTRNLPRLLPDLGLLTRSRWTQLLSDKGSKYGASDGAPQYPHHLYHLVFKGYEERTVRTDLYAQTMAPLSLRCTP